MSTVNPRRWTIAVLMGASVIVAYLDRVNISHAIVPMASEFELGVFEKGHVLASFGWGYVAFMIFGGVLVDRFGSRRVVTWAVLVWSVGTALASFATTLPALIATRVLVGVGEAPLFPANARLVAEHFTEQQRGRATALFDVGSYVGAALAAPIVVFTMTAYGWRAAFMLCAAVGVVWALVWHVAAPRSQTMPPSGPVRQKHAGNLLRLIQDRRVIAASGGFFCYNYVKSVILAWFPLYLVTERQLDVKQLALIGMLPPLAAIASEIAAGALMDRAVRNGIPTSRVRKTCLAAAFASGSAILVVGAVPTPAYAITIFMIAFGGIIAASPAIWAIPADIAPDPDRIGSIGGIQNTVANVGTIIGPLATGAIAQYTGGYQAAFAATAAISVVGGLAYTVLMPPISPIRESA